MQPDYIGMPDNLHNGYLSSNLKPNAKKRYTNYLNIGRRVRDSCIHNIIPKFQNLQRSLDVLLITWDNTKM